MNNINIPLKMKCVELGVTEKQLSEEMQISESQLNRKINQRRSGASYSTLTFCEKFFIAQRLKMSIDDIV